MGVAALVLGILSLLTDIFMAGGLGVGALLGVIGVILGAIARKKADPAHKGIATAGFVCSIIGLILGIITFIACGVLLAGMGAAGLETYNY